METFGIVSDEKTAYYQALVGRASDYGEYVDNRKMPQKAIGGIIQNIAHWVLGAAHDALDPVNRSQVMTAIDSIAPTGADQNILVVVRHADYFVGDDLAKRKN